jgi:hypothetical protein
LACNKFPVPGPRLFQVSFCWELWGVGRRPQSRCYVCVRPSSLHLVGRRGSWAAGSQAYWMFYCYWPLILKMSYKHHEHVNSKLYSGMNENSLLASGLYSDCMHNASNLVYCTGEGGQSGTATESVPVDSPHLESLPLHFPHPTIRHFHRTRPATVERF